MKITDFKKADYYMRRCINTPVSIITIIMTKMKVILHGLPTSNEGNAYGL